MQCPVDGDTLVMSDKQGIEIDYCPKCRGVWLDRGEIDKIIERSAPMGTPHYAPQGDNRRRDYEDDDNDRHRDHGYNQKHHKRESWFGELFD